MMNEYRNARRGEIGGLSESTADRRTVSVRAACAAAREAPNPIAVPTTRTIDRALRGMSILICTRVEWRVGGSAWESNPPNPTSSGRERF